jgi:hypothetical protein
MKKSILLVYLILIFLFISCTKNNFEYYVTAEEAKIGLTEQIAEKYSIMALKDRQLYDDKIIQLNDQSNPQKKLYLNSDNNGYTMWKDSKEVQRTWNYIVRLELKKQKIYVDISFGH